MQLAFEPFGSRKDSDWNQNVDSTDLANVLANLVIFPPLQSGYPPIPAIHRIKVARGFTGHEHLDKTGFIHMNGRVYDPVLGRFLSPDPIVQAPGNSQSWNRYTYTFNNPLNATDPSGFEAEFDEEIVVIGTRRSCIPNGYHTHDTSLCCSGGGYPVLGSRYTFICGQGGGHFDLDSDLGSNPNPWPGIPYASFGSNPESTDPEPTPEQPDENPCGQQGSRNDLFSGKFSVGLFASFGGKVKDIFEVGATVNVVKGYLNSDLSPTFVQQGIQGHASALGLGVHPGVMRGGDPGASFDNSSFEGYLFEDSQKSFLNSRPNDKVLGFDVGFIIGGKGEFNLSEAYRRTRSALNNIFSDDCSK